MIFHTSGIDFLRQNPSKINCKMTSKIADLNFNLLWPENQTQDTSKTLPRRPHDAPRGPKTLQDVPKTAPGRLQDDPKTLLDASRYSQDALKTALNLPRHPKMLPRRLKTPQDASKTPLRRLQTSISSIFDRFLVHF